MEIIKRHLINPIKCKAFMEEYIRYLEFAISDINWNLSLLKIKYNQKLSDSELERIQR